MSRYALQPLQHFIALDPKAACGKKQVRQQGPPDAVSMQNRSDLRVVGGRHHMQPGLSGTLRLPRTDRLGVFTHAHEVLCGQIPFIFSAGRYQNFKRLAGNDLAVIAAGPNRPTSAIKQSPDLSQLIDLL